MKTCHTIPLILLILSAWMPCDAQITSAAERIRRQTLNAREHLTVEQVKANQITLAGKVFLMEYRRNGNRDVEQIDKNRYRVAIEGAAYMDFPHAGAVAVGDTILQGDVVIVRIKEGETILTLECIGVSAVGVWQ